MKNFTLLLAIAALAIALSTCSSNDIPCKDTDCRDYTSRLAAQAAFDADPDCRNDLDQDKDGQACEEPGNEVRGGSSSGGSTGGSNCPTTNACGCSGKNKAPCEADPCCKWTVGKGCGCK